jgi:hypothetical protein
MQTIEEIREVIKNSKSVNETKQYIEFLTIEIGRKMLNDDNAQIKVFFNDRHCTRKIASCYSILKTISYRTCYLKLNYNNPQYVNIVIHECSHLVHANHSPAFKALCAEYGSYNESRVTDKLTAPEKKNLIKVYHNCGGTIRIKGKYRKYEKLTVECPICHKIVELEKRINYFNS